MAEPSGEALSKRRSENSLLSRSPATALWVIAASGTLTVMAGAILGPVVNGLGPDSASRGRSRG